MSILSRARKFVSETTSRLSSSYSSDQTEPLPFVSDLVSEEYTNKQVWQHLLKVAREDPIGNRICVKLPRNVFDDWFVIKKRAEVDEGEELEEHDKNQQIQKEFQRMNAKYWLTKALEGMATFGHAALVFNYNLHKADVEGDGYQVATLDVFTDENMQVPAEAFDPVTGEPTYIEVWTSPDVHNMQPDQIPWSEVLWWNTDPKGRSIYGYSWMYSVWDLMVYLRESVDAMVWAHKKYGIGIWMWYLKGGISDTVQSDFEDATEDLSSRRALAIEMDKVDRVEWTGPSGAGTNAIVEGAEFTLGLIAAGSDIPKDIYTGVSAGAITGSEINNKALYATISKIQSDVTPYVLETIYRMGYNTDDMEIEWNTRYATDELEQAQIRQMNADALSKEKAAERGTDIQIGYGPTERPKDPTKNQNPAGVQT